MKKLFLLISLLSFYIPLNIEKYSKTGHDQFSELEFKKDDKILLVDMPESFIKKRLKELPKKFWGSATEYFHEYEDGTYVGKVVFSRSNKTNQAYVFDYRLEAVEYDERSYNIEGSLSVKGTIKKKTVEATGTINVEGSYGGKNYDKNTESSSMKITVNPGKKITLRVAGECKISNGFTKSYIMWICSKKAAWETVDIVTSYFELVEENA